MPRTISLPPKTLRILAITGGLLLIGLIYILLHLGQESTDDAAIEAHVVSLSSKIPGYIKKLYVLDNQQVKAGELLMEIDPSDYQLKLEHAKAALDAAKAAYNASGQTFKTTQISAPSNLDSAKANYNKALADLKRLQKLSDEARSREELDAATAALEDAKAKLRNAETAPKTIAAAKASKEELAAKVKQAEAELALAQQDLDNTKILAPMDGRITRKGIEQGDYVQSGEQLGYLVGNERWVVANFKETQIEHMKPGQHVSIEIDAFPSEEFEGKIDSIQHGTGVRFSAFPPENATGNYVKIVQRVPVKILFDPAPDAGLAIGPGLSVTPTIYTR